MSDILDEISRVAKWPWPYHAPLSLTKADCEFVANALAAATAENVKLKDDHTYFREEITFLACGVSELRERFKGDKQLVLVAELFAANVALRAQLAQANATIAELTTDSNAITLAANLARKSMECAQANERAEKAEAALLDAREAKNRFKKVASGLAAENLNETEELHGRINDMQASIASELRATGAFLALTVCQADFTRDTGKRSEVIAATKDALTTLLAKLEGKT